MVVGHLRVFERQRRVLMLVHYLTRRAPEWRSARQHLPECHAQRVEIRPSVQGEPGELFGTSKFWCSDKTSRRRNCGLETRFSDRLRQTQVDNFCRDTALILQTHHDVTRFDVPVNEVLFVHRSQPGGHLRCDFQRQLYFDPPRASDEMLQRLSLHELHCIEVTAAGSAQMEDRGNVWMTNAGGRTGFTQKTKPR